MKRTLLGVGSLAAAAALATSPLTAQFYVGAYGSLPTGDYGQFAKTGWMAEAGYGFWTGANDRLTLWGSWSYGSNSHEGGNGDKTNLMMALASGTYDLTAGEDGPYVLGHLGYLIHKYSPGNANFDGESEGGLAFGGGVGMGIKKFYVEGRYLMASIDGATTSFLLLGAGITF